MVISSRLVRVCFLFLVLHRDFLLVPVICCSWNSSFAPVSCSECYAESLKGFSDALCKKFILHGNIINPKGSYLPFLTSMWLEIAVFIRRSKKCITIFRSRGLPLLSPYLCCLCLSIARFVIVVQAPTSHLLLNA